VDYAQEPTIDLVVMGTRGRGGMAHALMGSVAERVVRTAPCPVLTVKHPEQEFLAPDALTLVRQEPVSVGAAQPAVDRAKTRGLPAKDMDVQC
jgi:hypothetical protein